MPLFLMVNGNLSQNESGKYPAAQNCIAGCFTVIFPRPARGSYSQTRSSTPCPAK